MTTPATTSAVEVPPALHRKVREWVRNEFGACRCTVADSQRGEHRPTCPWRVSNPRRVQEILDLVAEGEPQRAAWVTDLVAANERLRERIADFESISRAVERSHATVLEALGADGRPAAGRPLHLMVDSDGTGGLMHVHDELVADVDGADVPLVRWDMPMHRAQEVLYALTDLDTIRDLMDGGDEGPPDFTRTRQALADALDHLVRTGRARRTPENDLITPSEGDPEL